MEVEKIDRINALAHKAKSVGLTEEEKKERELLRKEYIASVRMNLRAQLDNVDAVSYTHLDVYKRQESQNMPNG